jgi:sirohydrochlorin ferrochelatase
MRKPPLVAVAHGSSYPAAAQTITALARQVTRLAPVIDIRVAFVQHAEPSLPQALAEAGQDAVVVPLLLSTGYHLTTDIAGIAKRVAGPLGPDQLLVTALMTRLAEARVPSGIGVVLAATGSSDPEGSDQIAAQAGLLAAELEAPVVPAFASAGEPSVEDAVARLREETRGPVAIASYLLAPGLFHDRLAKSGADWVTAPLGDHPAVAALVIDRYRTAA